MGCDIHMHIEYFDTRHKQDEREWSCADWFRLNKYYGKRGELKYNYVPVWKERCYDLFAILADVRNYNNIESISPPRGLPLDVSKEVLKDYRDWGDNAHSASYLTLQELIDFVYNKNDTSSDATFQYGIYYLTLLINEIKDHVESDGFIYNCDRVEFSRNSFNDVRIVFWFDN